MKKAIKKLIRKTGNIASKANVLSPARRKESNMPGYSKVSVLTTRMEKTFFPKELPPVKTSLSVKNAQREKSVKPCMNWSISLS